MRKFLLFFFIFIKFSDSFDYEVIMKSLTAPVSENLTTAVHSIMKTVFFKQFSTVNIISAVENPKSSYFIDFKESLMRKNTGFEIYRMDNHTHIQSIKDRLKIYNTILLDSFETFLKLYKNIDSKVFNFHGFYLLVLLRGKIPEIEEMFVKMFAKKIVNVNAIYDEGNITKVITFTPFKSGSCRNTEAVEWARYTENGKFNISFDQIFPDELKNFHKCEMKMATFERCPASCLKITRTGNVTSDGFDIRIVKEVEKALNFRLKMEILIGPEMWGNINPDGTTTGAIQKTLNDECDFTAGNFLLRSSRVNIMDPSIVYLTFPVVFAIPLGERLTPFEKLLRPFELVVWILMLVFISFGLLVIFIVNWKFKNVRSFVYGSGIKNPVVNMTIAVLGGTQAKLPRRNFARFLLMMFLLFCLVQRNIYQGVLYIFLQSDGRHKEVQSLKEMIYKKFNFFMFESYTDIIQSQKQIYDK